MSFRGTFAEVLAIVLVALNAARDVGGRLAALTLFGRGASGGSYAAIASLTNIVGSMCGALFYEFILADSSRGT